MLTWQQTEFLLKGVYLGLLVAIALLFTDPLHVTYVALLALLVLAGFLGVAAFRKIREGYRVQGRWLGFLIFLVLDNPPLVYAGVLLGMIAGTTIVYKGIDYEKEFPLIVVWPILGGAALGGVFYGLRHVR